MKALMKLAERAAALDESKILNAILANTHLQQEILDLNRIGQLFNKGIDSEGRRLSDVGGPYANLTLRLAEEKGRPKKSREDINLHDTGEFYRSFYIVLGSKEFYIEADTLKPGPTDLKEEWGEDILGLTQESKDELTTWIRELLVPMVRQWLIEGDLRQR